MRWIKKENPPKSLADFVCRNKNATWEHLSSECRRELMEVLAEEQQSWDGYTERVLKMDDKNTHIDHFKKRALFPELTFKYNIALKQGRCDVIEAIKSLKNSDCSSSDILTYLLVLSMGDDL